MTTDKTGAPTTVTAESDSFTISVEDQKVGFTEFTAERHVRKFAKLFEEARWPAA